MEFRISYRYGQTHGARLVSADNVDAAVQVISREWAGMARITRISVRCQGITAPKGTARHLRGHRCQRWTTSGHCPAHKGGA